MSDVADPIMLEIFGNLFSSIAEEMGQALCRSAYSPNIKERRDFSCAIFNDRGEMIAQAAHIPVHLGSAPLSVQAVLEEIHLSEGDMAIVNDPYHGGTHLPDITIVAPLDIGNQRFYVANRAHHADIGGISAGSMPLSSSIEEEGIRIPPTKIFTGGKLNDQTMDRIVSASRTPEERRGDLEAQFAANFLGIRRLKDITRRYPPETIKQYGNHLLDYAQRMTELVISELPDGIYNAIDYLDDDGFQSKKIPIVLELEISGCNALLDFSSSAPQVRGCVNCVYPVTLSAAFYCFRCISGESVPANSGGMRPLKVISPPGLVISARYPAAVAGGNVETSQRIVDVVFKALSLCFPELIPAASQGTMNNVSIGGWDPIRNRSFTYYETLGGGTGAGPGWNGENAIHSHMTNTLNTPIEAIEREYPFKIMKYAIREASGGNGSFKGGNGLIREYEFFADDIEITLLTERRQFSPYGLAGGEKGKPGENILFRSNGTMLLLGSKCTVRVNKGDILRIETPGGGGWGLNRDNVAKT